MLLLLLYNFSVRNSFWKCPAETSGQNNIWPASCEFCLEKKSKSYKPALYSFIAYEIKK